MRWIILIILLSAPAAMAQHASTAPTRLEVHPGQSLAAARDAVRGRAGSTIVLTPGTYVLEAPLEFTAADSDITWTAQGGGAIISGGRAINGWHAAELNGRRCIAAKIPQVRQGKWYFRDLWINGHRAIRARSPNEGYFKVAASPDGGTKWEQGQTRFQFAPGDLPPGPFQFGAEAILGTRWVESRLPITSVDQAHHLVSFSRRSQWRIEPGDCYWLEGDGRWLDKGGEWSLDRAGGVLYYLPRPGETIANLHAVAPVLSTLIELKGDAEHGQFIENLTFRGITFSYNGWSLPQPDPAAKHPPSGGFGQADLDVPAAVQGQGLRRCCFDHCTFAHLGTWGLDLGAASQRCIVRRCAFSDLGAGGIRVGPTHIPRGAALQSFDNSIDHCDIGDGGNRFPSATGIWIGQSFDNHIEYNHVHDLYYTGISAGWSWGYRDSLNRGNLIEHNLVDHIGRRSDGSGPLLSDMGGVYLLGARNGTSIRNNIFHDIAGVKYGGWGIYLDEGSSDVLIENNLVYRTTHGSFHLHYGADNLVRHNIFAFAGNQQIVRTRVEDHLSATFEGNIVIWNGKTPMTKTSPAQVRFNHNLYLLPEPGKFRAGEMTWKQWQGIGEDLHSLLF